MIAMGAGAGAQPEGHCRQAQGMPSGRNTCFDGVGCIRAAEVRQEWDQMLGQATERRWLVIWDAERKRHAPHASAPCGRLDAIHTKVCAIESAEMMDDQWPPSWPVSALAGVVVVVEQSDYGAAERFHPASAPGRGRDLWGISGGPTPRDARPWSLRAAH